MAKEEWINSFALSEQAGVESEALEPACPRQGIEAASRRTLELSEKDGSIVLYASSMFVTAEVMTARDKITDSQCPVAHSWVSRTDRGSR
jgi:hypothetical protein